jgi:Arm domain-containing DNA-binding protein
MPLTDTALRNAKPAEKAIRLFDGGGLYLEVSPAEGKWWRFKYRFGGKEKRLSLGVYRGRARQTRQSPTIAGRWCRPWRESQGRECG